MEPVKPKVRTLNKTKPALLPRFNYFEENREKYWCQSGAKPYQTENKNYSTNLHNTQHTHDNQNKENDVHYHKPQYDIKPVYFGEEYNVLCRFYLKYKLDFSNLEKKPIIDMEHLKQFMSMYIRETTLRTLDNKIYSSKQGPSKINEYVIRGLFNIALAFNGHRLVLENEIVKTICFNPLYNLAYLSVNPNDPRYKEFYNKLCSKTYETKPYGKQELGEERGFYIMQMDKTFYLISHEIYIQEIDPDFAILPAENKSATPNILSFHNIASMYTGNEKGYKLVNLNDYRFRTAESHNTENKIVYNVQWSTFYLTEMEENDMRNVVVAISNPETVVKRIRDNGYYKNHTGITHRQKLIFDIVTMFCDGLSVGFELNNSK